MLIDGSLESQKWLLLAPKILRDVLAYESLICLKMNVAWVVWTLKPYYLVNKLNFMHFQVVGTQKLCYFP